MRALPKPNEIYRHFKGNCYRIMTLATETETRQTLVVYQALYGDLSIYARELSMFMSPVDKDKYPEVQQQWRFELVPLEGTASEVKNLEADKTDKPETAQVSPELMEYLDADSYEQKLQILTFMKERLTDDIVNTMAIAIDVEIPEGSIQERYEQLKYCLETRVRFECNRLR